MAFTVRIKNKAQKALDKLPAKDRAKILQELLELKYNPWPHGAEKLHGIDGYRIRAGDYRILFSIDKTNREVFVFRIKHRKEAYNCQQ